MHYKEDKVFSLDWRATLSTVVANALQVSDSLRHALYVNNKMNFQLYGVWFKCISRICGDLTSSKVTNGKDMTESG